MSAAVSGPASDPIGLAWLYGPVWHVLSHPTHSASHLAFTCAFVAVNGWAFCAMAYDKAKSKCRKRSRTAETRLLQPGLVGGALGVLAGMLLCAHKTRKWRFWLTECAFLVWNAVVLSALLRWSVPPFNHAPAFGYPLPAPPPALQPS